MAGRRLRRLRQPELDALDERFRLATAPVPSSGMSERATSPPARWWRSRYPRLVTRDSTADLPATWSPAPTYIG
ncbi:hypothetical protein SBRY_20005 [Actinacidiphila bryophytorum]|uniref:Uncharacterized protein n=1 Tax=Actinacidiphila bryophytorum TaxID=1436133 RepID=A0A9W4E5Y6_9ACTN|nr:hypothetical protein SBRY_20005 [Actinacidiphila bryophytorum]